MKHSRDFSLKPVRSFEPCADKGAVHPVSLGRTPSMREGGFWTVIGTHAMPMYSVARGSQANMELVTSEKSNFEQVSCGFRV